MKNKDKKNNLERAKPIMKLFGTKGSPRKSLSLTKNQIMKALGFTASVVGFLLKVLWEDNQIIELEAYGGGSVNLCRNKKRVQYKPFELLGIISPEYFDIVGKWLAKRLEKGTLDLSDDKEDYSGIQREKDITSDFIQIIIGDFAEAGLVQQSGSKIFRMSAETLKKKELSLDYHSINQALIASRFTNIPQEDHNEEGGTDEFSEFVRRFHAKHDQRSKVKTISVSAGENGLNILNISPNLGDQDFDIEATDRIMEELEQRSADKKPNVVVVDALIMGDYPNTNKANRSSLAISLLGGQAKAGLLFIQRVKKCCPDAKVIVNLSRAELRLCYDMTFIALDLVRNKRNPKSDKDKKSLNYHQCDAERRSRDFDYHYWFEFFVAYPYMLRCGRKLKSADKVEAEFGMRYEEYILLLDTYNRMKDGHPPSPEAIKILEIDNIPVPGKEFDDFTIVDDFNLLAAGLDGSSMEYCHRHCSSLTGVAQTANALKAPRAIFGQLAASGEKLPDFVSVNDQGQSIGVIHNSPEGRSVLIASEGDLRSFQRDRSGFYDAPATAMRRRKTVRGDAGNAHLIGKRFLPDGRIHLTIQDPAHLALMNLSTQRVAVPMLTDIQTGSVTMAPHVLALYLDYVMFGILPTHPMHLLGGGDFGQCHNYKQFIMENHELGLSPIDYQYRFNRHIIKSTLGSVSRSAWENLLEVLLVIGNHEWNTMYAALGVTHLQYLIDIFDDLRESKGLKFRLRYPEKVVIPSTGEYFKSFTGSVTAAGYNILLQHFFLERGAKGNVELPALQAKVLAEGIKELLSPYHFMLTGHWHHANYFLHRGLMAIVSAALATMSGYEWWRGHRSELGQVVLYLGGGEPPVVEFLTPKFFANYVPKGAYSKEVLADRGFHDDPGYNFHTCGIFTPGAPKSAIQQELHHTIREVGWGDAVVATLPTRSRIVVPTSNGM